MIKYFCMLVIALCFSNACDTVEEKNNDENVVLKSGTSFGFCGGYCRNEMQLKDQEVLYEKSSRDTVNYPVQTVRGMISRAEWNSLLDVVDISVLSKLNDIYGCPDCADGGAEWIEVYYHNFHKKVTFEYGDTVKPVESLILHLRALRKRFE